MPEAGRKPHGGSLVIFADDEDVTLVRMRGLASRRSLRCCSLSTFTHLPSRVASTRGRVGSMNFLGCQPMNNHKILRQQLASELVCISWCWHALAITEQVLML